MSADFVVCNKDSSIIAVIELDDESHEREIRKTADSKKNKALSDAGISMVRWQVKMLPDEPKIKASILPNSALKEDVPKTARPLA
jgi:very-short-patch-repair endonuclease